jgi:predicted DNA-binding protein
MKKSSKIKTTSFSTTLSVETKLLLERYCEKTGQRMNHIVEKAIVELIEDAMDSDIIEARELEGTVEWKRHG